MIEHILGGLALVLQWKCLLAIIIGTNIGIIFGAIPGLTGSMAIALLIPMTFSLSPEVSITLLMGIYKGSMFGGSIPAILINTPGVPASAPTCYDGYAMTKQGLGLKALRVSLVSSFFGDLLSDLCLLLVAAPLAAIAIKVAAPDYSTIIIFSLTIVASVASEAMLKGIVAGALGILLSIIGMDPLQGSARYTFDIVSLVSGFNLLPMLIGLLCFSEILNQIGELFEKKELGKAYELPKMDPVKNRLTWADYKQCFKPSLLASGIGVVIGILPGLGATAASFLAYSEAKRISKHPEKFGHGAIEGIAASEAANNANCAASLIPLLTLGIPGDVVCAILVGALMIQGMRPGPMLMTDQPVIMYAVMLGLFLCDLTYRAMGLLYLNAVMKIIGFGKKYIIPFVIVLCILGAYAVNSDFFDIIVVVAFGIIGWVLNKFGYSPPALLIGFILGPMLEESYRQTILIYGWSPLVFITRPFSLVMLLLTVFAVYTILKRKIRETP